MPHSVALYSSFHMAGRVYFEYAVLDRSNVLRFTILVRPRYVIAVLSVVRVTVGVIQRNRGSGTLTGTPGGAAEVESLEVGALSLRAA